MIIVNRKPFSHRQNRVNQDKVIYYVTEMVNWNVLSRPNSFKPPTDVLETDEKVIIRVEIAGISVDNLSIIYDQHQLSIQGIRQDLMPKRAFHQMEVHYGEFSTEIDIPVSINPNQITADYRDGFLIIELPKLTPTQTPVEDDK